ncbi:hypothetical protein FRACYDRAFT_246412 [Fragilariopsis cylindrus CCMP1102]|uniref:Uncharacterized protein n=1 Tax=Fragilariopsis cylindrus CCMP1102 TaxID=635003 RepID=A0A1E7EZ69_9STRA|nr:hypothetical protein FRACYDRAFT_246412 [Fragilariopsis cylindrus CCMP1102]|eukprot:OEU11298.1 hypothetical protein FRACYDRAFT_246412 [Fragilariopsis cylindrus CCMP1102]
MATATRAAAATRRRTRRLELITVLQQTEEFPVRSKNKTDQLIVIFLHAMNTNIDNEEDRHYHQHQRQPQRQRQAIPLSLGKASLRMRLEAYYSLISPEILSADHRTVWLRKYDQIYEKYGGTHDGERKLGSKLAKKYGTAVRLLVVIADDDSSNSNNDNKNNNKTTMTTTLQQDDDSDGGRSSRRVELITVLQQTETFPFRYENKFDQLVETFLDDFQDEQDEMLCDNYMFPLYDALKSSNIQGFKMVFEAGINFFPKKKGMTLLFRNKTNYNSTPFVQACMKFGEAQVKMMIEDTFIRCYSSSDDTPVVEALMTAAVDEKALMMAAVDANIHLDCVYFLLRRQPDIVQKLLSSASITTMAAAAATDMVVFNSNDNGISPKKRKRKDTQNIGDDGSTF